MKKIEALSAIGFLLMVLSSCSKPAVDQPRSSSAPATSPAKISSVAVVKVNADEVDVSVGGSAEAKVRLNIDSGYHVNANPPTFSYLKPTELAINSKPPISVGSTIYPGATTRKFQFADKPLAVYEGETVIKVQLKVDKGASQGKQNLSGKLRVQACDEEVCYPPGERDIVIPVNIK